MSEQEPSRGVGGEKRLSENAHSHLNNTSIAGYQSWAWDKAYSIRAVEQDGLPVGIVSVSVEEKYVPVSVVNQPEDTYKLTAHSTSSKSRSDSLLADLMFSSDNPSQYGLSNTEMPVKLLEEDIPVEFFGVLYIPEMSIVYRTPSGKLYKETITKLASHRDSLELLQREHLETDFWKALREAVLLSDSHDTIDNVSVDNPLDAVLKPNSDLSEGEILINDVALPVDTKVVDVAVRNTDFSRVLDFISGQEYVSFDDFSVSELFSDITGWVWGHISEIREDERNQTVYIVVDTPIDTAVFPFTLNHDTDNNNFWKLLDHTDGDLQSLRGEDVCVRLRGQTTTYAGNLLMNQDNDDIRTSLTGKYNQPIKKIENNGIQLFSYDDCPVNPIAVDTDYVWTLGLPPVDSFNHEHNSKNEQHDTDSLWYSSRLNKIRECLF